MTQEEQIRLYRLMEKLNWFFHQEMHYLDRETCPKRSRSSSWTRRNPYEYADLLF